MRWAIIIVAHALELFNGMIHEINEYELIKNGMVIFHEMEGSVGRSVTKLFKVYFLISYTAEIMSSKFYVEQGGHITLMEYTAFLGCVASTVLIHYSKISLGHYATHSIGTYNLHQIIRSGPYRWMRDPWYSGKVFFAFFILILLHVDPSMILLILSADYHLYSSLVKLEKTVMEQKFGDVYARYRFNTWSLF